MINLATPTRLRRSGSRSADGFSIVELAVTVAIILVLASVSVAVYLNSRNEAYDTKAREHLEQAANQASARLISDRHYTYASYGGPTNLAQRLLTEDPALNLVPLAGGSEPDTPKYLSDYVASTGDYSAVGVAIGDNGAVVFSALSESGRCWMLRHDPAGKTSNPGMVFAQGNPETCGWAASWASDSTGDLNQPPIAANGTRSVPVGGGASFSLAEYASDPDGGPNPLTFTILPSSEVTLDSFDPNTGAVSFTAPDGVTNASYALDYEVSDGAASDSGRITLTIDSFTPTGLVVDLVCSEEAPYGAPADCEVVVVSGLPDGPLQQCDP